MRKTFYSLELEGYKSPLRIEWEIYKTKGSIETKLGDILVIVNYQGKESNIMGVSSLEAKRLYKKDFEAINFEQLKKIIGKFPFSKLLLYDYENISDFQLSSFHITKMAILPTNICLALRKKIRPFITLAYL